MGVLSMKDRLRRLLSGSGSSKFRKDNTGIADTRTEAESVGSDDDDLSSLLGPDPYADVREQIEELSLRDRKIAGIVPSDETLPEPKKLIVPTLSNYLVYIGYGIMIVLGRIYDFVEMIFKTKEQSDYAPLFSSWGNFYTRHVYARVQDAFCRPLASSPGTEITILERYSADNKATMNVLGPVQAESSIEKEYIDGDHFVKSRDGSVARKCLNLGSYNYLGFGDGDECREAVKASLDNFPISSSGSRTEFGTTLLHKKLERTVADFLGKQDALAFSMGFNTNATTIPALMGSGDLILSDELNHTSIVTGARASGASIRVFPHDNVKRLEHIIREAVVMGRPRTRRPWNRIWVLVEGIYSMEGEYCDLRSIVRLAKKYGVYVYLDEAHSIGAMGQTARGITEHCGVDTADIDIMMGTFTKSFGGMGGYIAANKDIIDHLRENCAASLVHNSLSPTVCQQVISAFQVISGADGTDIGRKKIQALRDNSNYFRLRLRELGLQVLGQYDSPVVPVMLFEPGKIAGFSREAFKRGLATVVVGFPAVPLAMARVRFCVSAGHTRAQLDRAIDDIAEVSKVVCIRYMSEDPRP